MFGGNVRVSYCFEDVDVDGIRLLNTVHASLREGRPDGFDLSEWVHCTLDQLNIPATQ